MRGAQPHNYLRNKICGRDRFPNRRVACCVGGGIFRHVDAEEEILHHKQKKITNEHERKREKEHTHS